MGEELRRVLQEVEKYVQKERRKRKWREVVKDYFGFVPAVGGAFGTAVAYWATLVVKTVYEFAFYAKEEAFNELLAGNYLYAFELLGQADPWAEAGKAAFAGGIAGLIITGKLKRKFLSLWRR